MNDTAFWIIIIVILVVLLIAGTTRRRPAMQPMGVPVQQPPMGSQYVGPQQPYVAPPQPFVAPQTNGKFCQNCGMQLDQNEMQTLMQNGKVFCKNCGTEIQ
jgi:hypothetical protein